MVHLITRKLHCIPRCKRGSWHIAMTFSSDLWQPSPFIIPEPVSHIDLWRVRLGKSEGNDQDLRSILASQELDRADRFRFPHLRNDFVLSHAALRTILARYLKVPPQDIRFYTGEYGKPEISSPLNHTNLQFNLSHSGEWAIIAVTQDRAVGVDVEKFRSDVNHLDLAHRYFSEREYQSLLALPVDERESAFFICWTRKEAFLKALGEGLSYPLSQFSVTISAENPGLEHVDNDPTAISRWKFTSFQPGENYYGTVVYEKGPCELNQWDWNWDDQERR